MPIYQAPDPGEAAANEVAEAYEWAEYNLPVALLSSVAGGHEPR